MKKFISAITILFLVFILTGCTKVINTEYKNVDVTVVDKYHRSAWVQPVFNGKTTHLITHPAKYRIIVEYENTEYRINGSDVYNRYKDKVGQQAIGICKVRTYDNGTVKYDVIDLQ